MTKPENLDCNKKFKIMRSIDRDLNITLDLNDMFYLSGAADVSFGGMLYGKTGRGNTADEAINEHFKMYCEEKPIVKVGDKYFRWNDYVWTEQGLPS